MTRKRLYIILFAASMLGFMWISFQVYFMPPSFQICLFKRITTLPCPSCGSTRAIVEIVRGNFWKAIQWNPLGIMSFGIMTLAPPWILYDVATGKDSLLKSYIRVEEYVRIKWVAIALIALLLVNWIWNIYKGL